MWLGLLRENITQVNVSHEASKTFEIRGNEESRPFL
jgi:hypothetical protein